MGVKVCGIASVVLVKLRGSKFEVLDSWKNEGFSSSDEVVLLFSPSDLLTGKF